jgi:hypothetical protein
MKPFNAANQAAESLFYFSNQEVETLSANSQMIFSPIESPNLSEFGVIGQRKLNPF